MKYSTKLSLLLALLFTSVAATAQFTVTGNVSDSSGEPLIGVSIIVKGSTTGTVTDFNGDFSLNVGGESADLQFSYTGFASQTVNVTSGSSTINVVLEEDIANLEEVVVTGLASGIKRSNLANNVATISGQELTEVTTQQTVDGALYGKMTGVNIVSTSGAPGGGIAMRLRGVSSLTGNNQPLFIIDGVYISNVEIPNGLRFASGANAGNEENASNRIADLNPEDIESIEVLKGASAAAIYGTRANAGVVIITTKQGKAGKTKVRFEQDFGANTIQRYAGRRQYTADEVEAAFGADERKLFEEAQAAGEIFDYEKEIYGNTGFISDSRLSVSGGNDKTVFYFNTSYRDEEGIIENTGFDRFSMRLNVDHKITDKIRIGVNTNYINSFASRSFTGNENEGGLSYGYNLAFTRDWVNLFPDELGNYPFNPNAAGNPIFVRDNTLNEERNNRLISGANLEINLFQNDQTVVKVTGNAGLDFLFNETFVYVPETHQGQVGRQNGFIGAGRNKAFNYNYQSFLVVDHFTESNINFNTQVGVSYLNFDRNFVLNQATQLIPGQRSLDNAGAQEIIQTLGTEEEFGFVAQEQINFDDKIIGTLGIRFDKSSLNGDPNKYFAFPRASLAVNVANFDFWNVGAVSQFKLRAAYGETGSSAAFGSLFTSLVSTNIDGQVGVRAGGSLGDANLEPETSQELEFGADIGILDNKLNLGITYYIRDVENLLYQNSLPTSTGFVNESRRDLDLRNQGLEISLGLTPVRTESFTWNSNVNYWFNRSEVTRLGVPPFVPPGVAFGLGLGTFFVEQGQPITQFKGNGPEGPITIGDSEPDFQLGWFNQIKIGKNIDFNFLTHWKQGGDVLNLTRLLTDLGGVTPEEYSDLEGYIEDGSYFRLREVGLYYTLPKFTNAISRLRVGVSGRNLITLTDYSSYDPEVSTKGGSGLSNSIEVTPFPSSRQAYFHITAEF
ncbi:SusC/RagA family TonB-linked outer membrane protein [Phaeodactylibacter luteus]|uniref:SusC/RagA family TonB-linked outer membrane protein n=1 Tax=Phaeodactylibacter luteus TaxID=1564516 RepID=A0A5C6S347_9BACT|nr:SusC/RagA family TonB-linked outer membrane protein [Phaeodactylibacter luteus]TXB68918.1 SusC/RagA family TonB-linked outer membrane protein [Phaeodactylibacter luteus]